MKRVAKITRADGKVVFEREVDAPTQWSDSAVAIVAQKYLTKDEHSVYGMIHRVVDPISDWGLQDGYFPDEPSANAFARDLADLLLNQKASFNSPIYFNVGVRESPQCSACFILGVDDTMESILDNAKIEGMIFKGGSGVGTNLSSLRSSRESLSSGGTASGPVSFVRGWDAMAGVIKSGGTTRRSALMRILNADHGDIREFIACKANEEKKHHALLAAGFSGGLDGEAVASLAFQNANNSVRVTDSFMRAVRDDEDWFLVTRDQEEVLEALSARDLMREIATAAHACGDPGLQFHDTINRMHTCPADGEQVASNPCCLVGDTLVDTSEGLIPIEQLVSAPTLPMAFAFDRETNLPVLRQIKRAWKAGVTDRLVEFETDKGVVVRCTPEHKILLRSGVYVAAQDLREGDRLRKIGRASNPRRGDRRYLNHRCTDQNQNGTVWQSRFMWEQAFGPVPDGMEVHHVDGDCTNDKLSNFELSSSGDHQIKHSTGISNPRYLDVSDESLVETWEALEAHAMYPSKSAVTPSRWNHYVRENGLLGVIPMAGSPSYGGRIRGMNWAEFGEWVNANRAMVNDRVMSVRHMKCNAVPVYDIEVDGAHNFGVRSAHADGLHSIVVSNSEYMWLDDTSCNLASINLVNFLLEDGTFDIAGFTAAVRVLIVAQDILVSRAGYPTPRIAERTREYRTLGLGYANLGALLMRMGLPYDSDEARATAAAITSLMTAQAYTTSAEIGALLGAFPAFDRNRDAMRLVLRTHWKSSLVLSGPVGMAAKDCWSHLNFAEFRNAQVTVLAPTGTIAFMMDCETTGIEPELSLVKHKKLVGGGVLTSVSQSARAALIALGYGSADMASILADMQEHGTVEGSLLKPEHLPVFDCAFRAAKGTRSISWQGHVDMMAAVQPFLSGAISKTVGLPAEATVEDVQAALVGAWERGLKSVAIYRDGSKGVQPMSSGREEKPEVAQRACGWEDRANHPADVVPVSARKRLPVTRQSLTHKFSIAGHEGYLTVGLYPDGTPGELFVTMSKEGSTIGGLVDSWAIALSHALQYGVSLADLVGKFKHVRFEPAGITKNPEIRFATSIVDYIARFLEGQFLPDVNEDEPEEPSAQDYADAYAPLAGTPITPILPARFGSMSSMFTIPGVPVTGSSAAWTKGDFSRVELNGGGSLHLDGPPCSTCGGLTQRAGSCYVCPSCGGTSGCS